MTTQTNHTLVITRIFNAPRELVWKAFSDVEMLKKWWGPRNFTSPAGTIDFRVGGKYHFCMRTPEGQDMWSTGIYQEIIPMEKIVNTDSFADKDGNVVSPESYGFDATFPKEMLVTLTFEDEHGKTKFTLSHEGVPSKAMHDDMQIGWNESFDKLAESLQ